MQSLQIFQSSAIIRVSSKSLGFENITIPDISCAKPATNRSLTKVSLTASTIFGKRCLREVHERVSELKGTFAHLLFAHSKLLMQVARVIVCP